MGKQSCLSGARGGALPSVLTVRPLTPSAEENVISPQVLHRLLLCLPRAQSWVPPPRIPHHSSASLECRLYHSYFYIYGNHPPYTQIRGSSS